MLPLVVEEDLGLVLQAPEGGGMDDPVAIALEFRARRAVGSAERGGRASAPGRTRKARSLMVDPAPFSIASFERY
jgi:hypothetical protein